MKSIDELVRVIQGDFKKNHYDKFIQDVTFPNFKKISPYSKLPFRFPLTLLVGPNGGGKSSILHALWGMPLNHSTSRFWFSTAVDPIAEKKRDVPRYWYTHYVKDLGRSVQTRKVKGRKRNGYWEPSKPSVHDGMDVLQEAEKTEFRATDRWTPVRREVKYINTKAETSAFDRFFYYTDNTLLQDRQNVFVKESERLRSVIDGDLKSKRIGRGEFVFENTTIAPPTLEIINKILGKRYISAKYIIHRFYDRNKAASVIFQTKSHTYSEAFAGSGELSVVNLILAIEKMEDFSLLLLDEPETSLHPGAQRELLNYLLDRINEKKLQVVISTHSPTLVELVPQEALVVLGNDESGIVIRHDINKSAAFYRLGQADPHKISILTEDVLLKTMVERSLKLLDESLQKKCEVIAVTLGASEMLSHQVPTFIMTGARAVMVLDGDQKPFIDLIDVNVDELSANEQDKLISKFTMHHVALVGINPDLKGYVSWCRDRISLIEEICPEQLFLSILNPNHPKLGQAKNREYKTHLKNELKRRGDDVDAHSMCAIFKLKLGEEMLAEGPVLKTMQVLADRILKALTNVGI